MRLLHCSGDAGHDAVEVLQDIVIRHTHHTVTQGFQATLSFVIVDRSADVAVAVDFDYEHRRVTTEIDEVSIDRVLPTETNTMDLASAKFAP
jgi:hypothetical protein